MRRSWVVAVLAGALAAPSMAHAQLPVIGEIAEPEPTVAADPVAPVEEAVPPVPVPSVTVTPEPTATPRPELPVGRTLRGAIKRAALAGKIPAAEGAALLALEERARAAVERLPGNRAGELAAVLRGLDELAAQGVLVSSRVRLAGLTLRRNLEVFRLRPFPRAGERFSFGDAIVFQYWPGRGLQHHPLASAGRINALAQPCLAERRVLDRALARQARRLARIAAKRAVRQRVGEPVPTGQRRRVPRIEDRLGTRVSRAPSGVRCRPAALRRGTDALLSLGAQRHGFLAWEYLVRYGAGRPPWVSGMAQATTAQALARSGRALDDQRLVDAALAALGAFDTAPPAGVRVAGGRHFLMYSFDPGLLIYNGLLQSVIGLHDVADLTGSRRARRLSATAERAARASLGHYDTGAWTIYSRNGREASLGYHRLVRGFTGGLCDRTRRAAWCAAERRFTRYLTEPPRIRIRGATRARRGRPVTASFTLSKTSAARVRVIGPKGLVIDRRLTAGRSRTRVSFTARRAGRYVVRVDAKGPEGRRNAAGRTVTVTAPRPAKRR